MDIGISERIHVVEDRGKEEKVMGFGRYVESKGGIMYKKDKNMARGKDLMGKGVQYAEARGGGGIGMGKRMIEGDGGRY
ncbi:ABC transporter substrate-binding protein, partial [Staphylococcus epidermidis]|uniref:ABC transporter substrate-binding protein n=1 Tax=Staphylococcus epidermidis TaxID=1282 RepID=UPI0021B4057F